MENKFQKKMGWFVGLIPMAVLLFASSVCAETNSTNTARQAILFQNGDILFGNLKSISADKSVVWQRNDVFQPIEFSATKLSEIQFPPMKKVVFSATNGCRIQLRNGDSFEGKLLQLDSEKIILETSFAGKMTFPRAALQVMEPLLPESAPIFTGPTGVDGWTMGKITSLAVGEAGQWSYTNGAFYATRAASIARDVKLPDVARIEFDLAWKGTLQAAIALYTSYMQPINLQTKDNEPDFGGFYSLQINSYISTLMPVRKNEPLKYLGGQIQVPTFSQKNHAHIEILASKPKRSITLLVDGLPVKEWVDTDDFAGNGTGMRFVHQGQGALKLSNLRIAEWNGKMEFRTTNLPPYKEDIAKLLNGDKVSGTVEFVRDGKVAITTTNGKLNIPFERVSGIYFRKETQSSPEKMENQVRAFFNGDVGSVTFQIEHWDETGVAAKSENFGHANFAPGTFDRIQLNPDPIEPTPSDNLEKSKSP